jgi:hypothetical protein
MFSKLIHFHFVLDLYLTLFWVWQEQKEQQNTVGSDEVGLLGELFMLPYCTSPDLGGSHDPIHLLLMQNMSRIRKEKSSKAKCSGSFPRALTDSTACSDTLSHLTNFLHSSFENNVYLNTRRNSFPKSASCTITLLIY